MKIYSADYVVTQNDGRDIIRNGAVAVDGALIAGVGTAKDLRAAYPDAVTNDMGHSAICPGLVNGHTHIPMSLLRGYSDDKALIDWLQKDIFPAEEKLTAEAVKLGSLLSCAEMMRTGTTAFMDMYMLVDSIFEAADSCGMRAVLGWSISGKFPNLDARDEDSYLDKISDYAAAWRGHPLISTTINPHSVYTTDKRLLLRCREFADAIGIGIGIHMSETAGETENCLAAYGMRPVEYCEKIGLLGPDVTLYHMVDADDSDIAAVKRTGCAVVHNPASNMKLASGAAPIGKFAAAGIGLSLGTDGPASNNAQNMFGEMRAAALMQKLANLNPREAPAQLVLDMATRGGASALRIPGLGVLKTGGPADFIALDLTLPNMHPIHNIVSNMVYAASGFENRLTVVAGRELYRDGVFKTLDYERLLNRFDETAKRIIAG